MKALHYIARVPEDGVAVKILCRIKPQNELFFSATSRLCEDVGMECVWLLTNIPQETRSLSHLNLALPIETANPSNKIEELSQLMY